MLATAGTLLSCFTHERKHRLVKRFTLNRVNVCNYEVGTMEDITLHHLGDIQEPWINIDGPLGAHKANKKLHALISDLYPNAQDILVAPAVASQGERIHAKDVALVEIRPDEYCVCHVQFHMVVDRMPSSCVTQWLYDSSPSSHTWKFQVRHDRHVICPTLFRASLVHSCSGTRSHATMIVPRRYRVSL